jgi:tripartite-type tricarboxylate transporter receptor subunit TctC
MNKRKFASMVLAVSMSLSAFVTSAAFAQANPKPVRIIVSFTAGGPVDFVARTLAVSLSKELGRTVVVENKPGANGAIGAAEALRAEADGSTLWITSVGAAAINPSLYEKLAYDMQRDFVPVSLVVNNVEVFVVAASHPATDAADFINRAKAQKDPTAIASSGTGSIPHLALLQLQDSTKLEFVHVPYNGMAPALTDLQGGQVAGVFADVPAVMAQIKNGRLKALGMASAQRHPGLPEVKTFEELGIKAVDTNNWYGLFASSKNSKESIDVLNKAVARALNDPETRSKLLQSGAEPKASSTEELARILKADTSKWSAMIRSKNIKVN